LQTYFDSHCGQILRRFRRVCAALGSEFSFLICEADNNHSYHSDRRIRFVSCSATLANPSEYMSKMFGFEPNDVEVVSNDGAPSGSKEYLIWNPPLLDPANPTLGRRSSLTEASSLMRFLMKKGIRVILFCKVGPFSCLCVLYGFVDRQGKIRKICELVGYLTLQGTVLPTFQHLFELGYEDCQG
jgi:ATP-dependent helicase YprA (DUF1998 family)